MNAVDKNLQALTTVFGSSALAQCIATARIGIHSDDTSSRLSGRLLADALGDVLGRLWVSLDASGPLAEPILKSAAVAAASGNKTINLSEIWSPPYDAVVVLGKVPSGDFGPYVRIGCDGWYVCAGDAARFGDSPIPVGPAAAGALAGAEIFKLVFHTDLAKRAQLLNHLELDIWNFGRAAATAPPSNLMIPRTHLFGVGAVTHGLLWIIERWPGDVNGEELLLIDHDSYDSSNGQRYAGMRVEFDGRSKAKEKETTLRAAHPGLKSTGIQIDGDAYFDNHERHPNVQLAVVGVDSKEMRRHVALKLPRRTVNMWTEQSYVGSARMGGGDGWPCLMCQYPEATESSLDEVARISKATTIPLHRVRELIDGSGVLSVQDADAIRRHFSMPPESVLGRTLNTVMHEMCSTGKLQLPGEAQAVDVPFAFASMLAGVAGFTNLVQELANFECDPFDWSFDVLNRLGPNFATQASPRPDCMLCAQGYGAA